MKEGILYEQWVTLEGLGVLCNRPRSLFGVDGIFALASD